MPTDPRDYLDQYGNFDRRAYRRGLFSGGLGGGTATAPAPKPAKTDPFEDSIADVGREAYRAQNIEETRGANTEAFLRSELEKASKSPYDEDYYAKLFTGATDSAARTQMDQERGAREMFGASGITGGGYAQGLLTDFEGQRFATVTDARRSLAINRAVEEGERQYKRFTMAGSLATQMNREPSLLGMDYAQWAANQRLTKYGIDKQAKAAKKSSDNQLLGGIIGAAGSLLGGLF